MTPIRRRAAAVTLATLLAAGPMAEACARVVHLGPEGRVLTGRPFDRSAPITSNLRIFP